MKVKFVKIIFIVIVVSLIGFAIYFIYNKVGDEDENKIQEEMQETQYSTEITIGISNYDNINPIETNNKEIIYISKLIFEPLISLDEEYKKELCLAKECAKINSRSYLIKINNDIKWSDGTNLKVEDIEFTINKLKQGNSVYSSNVSDISNVQLIDNSTIRIDLNKDNDFFEYNLIFPIIQKGTYTDVKSSENSNLIGTGLYKITSIENNKIVLEKNNNWNREDKNFKIEKINLLLFKDMGDLYNSFKIGNIDVIHTSNINYSQYIGTLGYKIKEYKGRELDFLSFNCENEILNQKEVRKAISFAIDKSNIIQEVYNNKYYVSDCIIDYGTYIYKKENVSLGYNIEQSKKILSEAGWTYKNNNWQKKSTSGVTKRLSLSLVVQKNNENRLKVAELIKKQLEQVGIEITIKKVTDSQYMEYLQNKNYDIILTGINNGFCNDLQYFYGEGNIANYNNAEVKDIINELKNMSNDNLVCEKYNRLFEITQEDMPYITLYRNKNILILNQRMSGEFSPNNYSLFYNFWTWCKQ